MSEKVNAQIVNDPEKTAEEEQRQKNAEIREQLRKQAEEEREKLKSALEAMREGKGRLALETPILAGDKEITELVYDFTELTGMEYTEAKQNEGLDMQDIVSRIGATDAAEAIDLASIFFGASIRAGRKRISKK